jgi:hypothetical protein
MMITRDKIDHKGIRRVKVEPATHEPPKLEGWKCVFVGYVGPRDDDPGYTNFAYKRTS